MVDTENRKFGLGVVLLVLNKNMTKILLLKRSRDKKRGSSMWANVGGIVEMGEYLIDACIREAKEETGLILDKKDIKFLLIKETPKFLPNVHALHFFYFTKIDDKAKICLNCESEGCTWFDINKLPKDVLDKDLDKLIKLAQSKK